MSAQFEVHRNAPELVVINTQKWMLYNYTFNGTYPNNTFTNIREYGSLFTWAEAMAINLPGWHMPTDVEYGTLIAYLGGNMVAGGKMKEIGTTHWTTPNTGADNSSGFTARGAGYNESNFGMYAQFWTASEFGTDAYAVMLTNISVPVYTYWADKGNRYSVRLIKDV